MTRPYILIGTRGGALSLGLKKTGVFVLYIYNLYLIRCITVYIYIYICIYIYIYIDRIKQCNLGVGLMFHQSVSLSSWASGKCLSSSFTSTPHWRMSNSAL